MHIELYADGADYNGILQAANNPRIKGFTTNPTLMRKAGIPDYQQFAVGIIQDLKRLRPDTNISLEVFADDISGMIQQGRVIHSWGKTIGYPVYVKVPITTTTGQSTIDVIHQLSKESIPCNITAVFTPDQVVRILPALIPATPTIISIFAGRIADIGIDPEEVVQECIRPVRASFRINTPTMDALYNIKFLWASPREVFNVIQANRSGCDIITMTPDLLGKLAAWGPSLEQRSLETVQMFYTDAQKSEYTIVDSHLR